MLRTKRSRLMLIQGLGIALAIAFIAYAPFEAFVLKVSFGQQGPLETLVYFLSGIIDMIVVAILGAFLLTWTWDRISSSVKAWISKGEEESPAAMKRKALKALRADTDRLMIEAAKVPELTEKVANLERELDEYRDPPKPEGYLQPAFEPEGDWQ